MISDPRQEADGDRSTRNEPAPPYPHVGSESPAEEPGISFQQFGRLVRKFRTSALLSVVAQLSVDLEAKRFGRDGAGQHPNVVQEWALAAIAKVSIVEGGESGKTASVRDVYRLCDRYFAIEDPLTAGGGDPGLASFMVRIAYEQFPTQTSAFEGIARTEALFGQAAAQADQINITPDFWVSALGCSLREFVGVGQLLHAGAMSNGGYYDPSWLRQPNFAPILDLLGLDVIQSVVENFFLATVGDFQREARPRMESNPLLRKVEFNPLMATPFVRQPDGRFLAPQPGYILTRISTTGLYYLGADYGGSTFTDALGPVFETYVGLQLALSNAEQLIPEIIYEGNKKTVDWIAVFPSAVVLIEAKATRLTLPAQQGQSKLWDDLNRTPAKARRQINKTRTLIQDRHPALAAVPDDRPIVGLIVTLEPYHHGNTDLLWTSPPADDQTLMASVREIEHLVTLTDRDLSEFVVDTLADPERRFWSLGPLMKDENVERNSLLDAAWDLLPFGVPRSPN